MATFINIYDDEQSELILDSINYTPNYTNRFHNLGELQEDISMSAWKNAAFVEMNVFDADDNFIVTLNSGRPLLRQPSTGKFYFGEYHVHNGILMVGKKHLPDPHEILEKVRENQLNPYSYDQMGYSSTGSKKYVVKLSEVFEILKGLANITVESQTLFKIKYAIFGDVLLTVGARIYHGLQDDTASEEEQESGEF